MDIRCKQRPVISFKFASSAFTVFQSGSIATLLQVDYLGHQVERGRYTDASDFTIDFAGKVNSHKIPTTPKQRQEQFEDLMPPQTEPHNPH